MLILWMSLAGSAGVLAAGVSRVGAGGHHPAVPAVAVHVVRRHTYIPNDAVGIVEKLWSLGGSVGEGQIIASSGEAGYQAHLPRRHALPAVALAVPHPHGAAGDRAAVDPLMVDLTVKRQREMGAIGKLETVRAALKSGSAAILGAINAAARNKH